MPTIDQTAARCVCVAFVAMHCSPGAATALDDIGYTRLQAELGSALPDGGSVVATLVEANNLGEAGVAYSPDPGLVNFNGKTITDVTGLSTAYSTHANSTGRNFFGAPNPAVPGTPVSSAPGITMIDSYWVDEWLFSDFVRVGQNQQPKSSSSRIANHSWIGRIGDSNADPGNTEALRRLDWLVETDEFIQVVGFTGSGSNPLLGTAYNGIGINKVSTTSTVGTASVGSLYGSGRNGVHLVGPEPSASGATARVASAAALLADLGHTDASLSTDPAVAATTNRDGVQVYNAERSETLKAALMAGATRVTHNSAVADMLNYRVSVAHQADNGLDRRYGAGQLDIYTSYQIIAAGEQNSDEDDSGGAGQVGLHGFDYDPAFGGAQGSNVAASYHLPLVDGSAVLAATLAWHIDIDGGSPGNFDPAATLHDLDLQLYDVSNPLAPILVVSSESAVENTETIFVSLKSGVTYMMRVKPANGQSPFNWDYALAWAVASDADGDGAADKHDNCIDVANGPLATDAGGNVQFDANGDGFGNACDADLNNDGVVNGLDVGPFTAEFGSAGPDADFNGDGVVNGLDVGVFTVSFGRAPGPSALLP